jgi:glycosyltransferase involved in cell wall biosynthesis
MNVKNPKVSIIVPVYNAEKYLHKCVNSILAQTFTDFECILIDDCSNDNSPAICDEYSMKDDRIKSVHNRNNMGSSLSRKIGLEISTGGGGYIQFIDSDDWIENDMIEKVYEKAVSGNYDIVYCDAYTNDESGASVYKKILFEGDTIKNIKNIILGYNRGAGLVYKLIKKSIYDDIIFPNEGFAEDKYITLQILHKVKKSGYMNLAFYHVYQNPNSQMRDDNVNAQTRRYIGLKENFRKIFEFLETRYGDNLNIFEPELSNRIKNIEANNPKNIKFIIKKLLKRIWEKRHNS